MSEAVVDTSSEGLSSTLFERERVLLSIDNQLISLGLRLTLLLPAFSLFTLLGAWAYDGTIQIGGSPALSPPSANPSVQHCFFSAL